jgi:hypothetical protein
MDTCPCEHQPRDRDGTDIAGRRPSGIQLRIQPDMPADGELSAAGIGVPSAKAKALRDVGAESCVIVIASRQGSPAGHEVSPRDGRAAMGHIRRIRADMRDRASSDAVPAGI